MQRARALLRDDFNRPDGAPAASWELTSDPGSGNIVIVTNQIGTDGTPATSRYDDPLPSVNHWASARIGNNANGDREVYARMTDSGNREGYCVVAQRFGTATSVMLGRMDDGDFTPITDEVAVGLAVGDKLTIEVIGAVMRLQVNNVQHLSTIDETYASGFRSGVGMGGIGAAGTLDDWQAGIFTYDPPVATVMTRAATNSNLTAYTTGTFVQTPAAGSQIQIWVEHRRFASEPVQAVSVTGTSITNAQLIATTVFNPSSQRLEVWVAEATGTDDPITIDFGGEEQLALAYNVIEVTNIMLNEGTNGVRQATTNAGGPTLDIFAETLAPGASDYNPTFLGCGNNQSNTMFARPPMIHYGADDHDGSGDGAAGGLGVFYSPWHVHGPYARGAGDESMWGAIAIECVSFSTIHEGTGEESFPEFGDIGDIYREIPIEIAAAEDLPVALVEAAEGKTRYDLFPRFGESATLDLPGLPELIGGQYGVLLVLGGGTIYVPESDATVAEQFPTFADAASLAITTETQDATGGEEFPGLTDTGVVFHGFVWPNASNTGPRAGHVLVNTAGFTASTPGVTYTDKRFTSHVNVTAENVTFRDCEFTGPGTVGGNCVTSNGTNALFEYCLIGRTGSLAANICLEGRRFTARYCEIVGGADLVRPNGCTIEYCFIHGPRGTAADHPDAMQSGGTYGGNTGLTRLIQHNYIQFEGSGSAIIFMADAWTGLLQLHHNYITGMPEIGSTKADRGLALHESGNYEVTNNQFENNSTGFDSWSFNAATGTISYSGNTRVSGGPDGTLIGTWTP